MFTLIAAITASQQPVGSAQRRSAHEESCTGSGPYQGDEREEGAACQATPARVWSPSYITTFGQRRFDQHQASLWHQTEGFACKTRQWDGLHTSICERSYREEGKVSKTIGPDGLVFPFETVQTTQRCAILKDLELAQCRSLVAGPEPQILFNLIMVLYDQIAKSQRNFIVDYQLNCHNQFVEKTHGYIHYA